jgi:ribonucleoside-diphosphate reductase alpha chain
MCPNECPGLPDTYGEEFERLYEKYEQEKKYKKQIKARDLWSEIMDSQIESGVPYVSYKDHINKKSNQKHYGIIRGSNLCCEIVEYSDSKEYAVCNLASISLPKFVVADSNGKLFFDHKELHRVTRVVTKNLDNIIDINYYPLPEARVSNLKHRPIGVGVQGLADVFIMLGLPFDSAEARLLNKEIFETIYHGSLTESVEIAKIKGSYETFEGSPFSQGIFQFDMWKFDPRTIYENHPQYNGRGKWDWDGLRSSARIHGVRNSFLTTSMPTASTSQILGNNEACEAYTSNLYVRETQAGNFKLFNKHLMNVLIARGMWNDEIRLKIAYHRGSIQRIKEIPDDLKLLFRTVYEIPQKSIIEMAADRAPFIDQTQSMNLFIYDPDHAKLTSCLFYGWELGLKTGMYYLRSNPAVTPIQFGVPMDAVDRFSREEKSQLDEAGSPRTASPNREPSRVDSYDKQEILLDNIDLEDLASGSQSKDFIATSSDSFIESEEYSEPVCVYRPKYLRRDEVCDMCSS